MKRSTMVLAMLVAASLAAAGSARAQGHFVWAGASAAVPIGDSKDGLKTGFLADVGLGHTVNEKLTLQLGGLFGSSSHKVGDGSTDLLGGSLGVGYTLVSNAHFSPYVLGSVGMMRADNGITDAESEFMFQLGAGLTEPLTSRAVLWCETRYLSAGSGDSKLTLVPLAIGVAFSFGGN